MAQFSLYENQNPESRETYPYFVDIQNALLDSLNSRLVIPLTPRRYLEASTISKLCPRVSVEGNALVLLTHQMTNVPVSALKVPVASLEAIRDEIVGAIDFLVTGI